MTLPAGTRLGPYEIAAPIGAGGMGEVYRARDTRLGRDVAVKVLPPDVVIDAERLARFRREAQTLAALNHSGIAQIYGLEESSGITALAMELVEGVTLEEHVAGGALPYHRARPILIQIAAALGAAHDAGIIHRDLKPSNIMLTAGQRVKLLDFGVAKRISLDAGSAAATVTALKTREGAVVGTAAYMSPEQATAQPVDKRTDIWALGCLMYQLLTGGRPFPGATITEVLASVLKSEPDWAQLPATLPPPVTALIRKCLEKDKHARTPDVAVVTYVLEDVAGGTPAPARTRRETVAWVVAGLMAVALLGALGIRWGSAAPDAGARAVRASLVLSPHQLVDFGQPIGLTPDGSTVVYRGLGTVRSPLFRRRVDERESVAITGTEGGAHPAISPDGQWVAFHNGTHLMKAPIEGGPATQLAAMPPIAGATWGDDGFIVTGARREEGLSRVSSSGGVPEPLTRLTADDNGNDHRWPQALPGGRGVLFSVSTGPEETARIVVLDARSGQRKDLLRGSASARYVPTGHLVYARNGSLFAVEFDLDRLEATGRERLVAEGVSESTDGEPEYAFSTIGDLVYVVGESGGPFDSLVLVDMLGNITETTFPARPMANPRFSPTGDRIAVTVGGAKNNVWTLDLARGIAAPITFGRYHQPTWTPDGRLTMARGAPNHLKIVQRAADDTTESDLTDAGGEQYPMDWTPDGRTLIYTRFEPGTVDLWTLTDGRPAPLLTTRFNERSARVSPDGRWLIYVSDETGRVEVFIRPMTGTASRRQVSVAGGTFGIWAPRGNRIYYRRPGLRGARGDMMAVDVNPSTGAVGIPRVLFKAANFSTAFDIDPSGQRFAMIGENPLAERNQLGLVLSALRR